MYQRLLLLNIYHRVDVRPLYIVQTFSGRLARVWREYSLYGGVLYTQSAQDAVCILLRSVETVVQYCTVASEFVQTDYTNTQQGHENRIEGIILN